MEFGIHFFPSVGPAQKSGEQYFEECLALVDRCDELDYRHVRIVEHYFHRYGGYSPNPLIFLAAAASLLVLPSLLVLVAPDRIRAASGPVPRP